jgi:hypothetical protein
MDVEMPHGHGQAALPWTSSIDMDLQRVLDMYRYTYNVSLDEYNIQYKTDMVMNMYKEREHEHIQNMYLYIYVYMDMDMDKAMDILMAVSTVTMGTAPVF